MGRLRGLRHLEKCGAARWRGAAPAPLRYHPTLTGVVGVVARSVGAPQGGANGKPGLKPWR
jgi:hypothetical protein